MGMLTKNLVRDTYHIAQSVDKNYRLIKKKVWMIVKHLNGIQR